MATAPNQDKKVSASENMTTCDNAVVGNVGGFALCAFLSSGASGDTIKSTTCKECDIYPGR
ncbi:MAG: hypothetical protein V3U75_11020 [Methylococcaceae bacterium]